MAQYRRRRLKKNKSSPYKLVRHYIRLEKILIRINFDFIFEFTEMIEYSSYENWMWKTWKELFTWFNLKMDWVV